jgi:hypothetical protein
MTTIIKYILLLSSVALVISGCSTMNKSECLTANWKNIGFGDGAKGRAITRISKHTSACAEYGITPDLNAYKAGRNDGLSQYCVPSQGYRSGVAGSKYRGLCVNHNEAAFLDAYNYGLDIHKEQKILNQLNKDYKNEERHIKHLNHRLSHNENLITSGKLTQLQTYKLLQENKQIIKDISHGEHTMDSLHASIAQQAHRIRGLESGKNY